jgi:hypothetical protein
MSQIEDEEQDPSERERMEVAGEFRRQHQKQISNPLAYTADTYDKIQKNKKKLGEEEEQRDELKGDNNDDKFDDEE